RNMRAVGIGPGPREAGSALLGQGITPNRVNTFPLESLLSPSGTRPCPRAGAGRGRGVGPDQTVSDGACFFEGAKEVIGHGGVARLEGVVGRPFGPGVPVQRCDED